MVGIVGLRLWGQCGPRPAALVRSEVRGLALPPLPPEPARGPANPQHSKALLQVKKQQGPGAQPGSQGWG